MSRGTGSLTLSRIASVATASTVDRSSAGRCSSSSAVHSVPRNSLRLASTFATSFLLPSFSSFFLGVIDRSIDLKITRRTCQTRSSFRGKLRLVLPATLSRMRKVSAREDMDVHASDSLSSCLVNSRLSDVPDFDNVRDSSAVMERERESKRE